MKYLKYFESPDQIIYKRQKYSWYDTDAYSFGYLYGEDMYISGKGETHLDLLFKLTDDMKMESRFSFEYAGRIWINSRVISFWQYPKNYKKLLEIISDIEDEFLYEYDIKLNIIDWEIEVPLDDDFNIDIAPNPSEWSNLINKSNLEYKQSKLIKVKEFVSTMGWDNKTLNIKHGEIGKGGNVSNFGSNKNKTDIPAEYKDKTTKYKYTENFNNFKNKTSF